VQNGSALPADSERIRGGYFAICRPFRLCLHGFQQTSQFYPIKEYTANFPLPRPFIPVVFASVYIILWNILPYTVENPVENVENSGCSEPVRQHAKDCINGYVNRGEKICINCLYSAVRLRKGECFVIIVKTVLKKGGKPLGF
jgi:hypothetical protein